MSVLYSLHARRGYYLGCLRHASHDDAYDVRIQVLGHKLGNETAGCGRELGRFEHETVARCKSANLAGDTSRCMTGREGGNIP